MARILKTNLAASTLASGITDSALSFTVASGEGALFPNPGAGEQMKVRIGDEIILCDSRSSDVFTVNASGRGHESTTAAAHSTSDDVIEVATAEDYQTRLVGHPLAAPTSGEDREAVVWDNTAGQFGYGSGGVPVDSWIGRLFNRPVTAHTDDDEFDSTGLGGWTEVDVSGTTTWTEDAHCANVVFDNQSSGDGAFLLKSMDPSSSPVTIETAVHTLGDAADYTMCGLAFTDGTAASSNTVIIMGYFGSSSHRFKMWNGTLTNISTGGADVEISAYNFAAGFLYVRLIWSAANTWKFQMSPTGANGSWINFDESSDSFTLTPTHFGLFVSKWGGVAQSTVSFDYFRVYETDESV